MRACPQPRSRPGQTRQLALVVLALLTLALVASWLMGLPGPGPVSSPSPSAAGALPIRTVVPELALLNVPRSEIVLPPDPTPELVMPSKDETIAWSRSYVGSHFGRPAREWSCLYALWAYESRWRALALNPRSGRVGIVQTRPEILRRWAEGKARAAPTEYDAAWYRSWQTNGIVQVEWGLAVYIPARYGTPCQARAHQVRTGWY